MAVSVDIKKNFGGFCLDVAFEAGDETLALLGASGCGKSLTLKCIAGIEKPDSGRIVLDGVTLFDSEKHINLSPQERRTGLMFQNFALFPNMTVLQNIRAGTRREKKSAERDRKISEIMERFDLSELSEHYPSQLSGGQQQRVALARILVSGAQILLLDEPFSALDSHLRFRLEQELREVIRDFGKTAILVSHDREEVYRLSDSIAIMNNGTLEDCGDKQEVFSNPKTRNGALLTGCKNISRVKRLGNGRVLALDWGIELALKKDAPDCDYVGIQMHNLHVGESGENSFGFSVVEEVENPFSFTIMLLPDGVEMASPIGIKMNKDSWRSGRARHVEVRLPPEYILPLKE